MKKVWQGVDGLKRQLIELEGLALDANNARLHSERNIRSICDSLSRFGQVKPIVVRVADDGQTIIAGNGTAQAARELGWTHIAAVTFAGSLDEARAFAIADNRTAELAEWDLPELAAQMQELITSGWNLEEIGWDEYAYAPLLDAEFEPRAPVETGDESTGPNIRVVFSKEQWDVVVQSLTLLRVDADVTDGEGLCAICAEWLAAR